MNYFKAVLITFSVIFSAHNSFGACEECHNDCELVGEIEIDNRGLCRMRVQNCRKRNSRQLVLVPAEPGLVTECDAVRRIPHITIVEDVDEDRLPPCRKNGRLVSVSVELSTSNSIKCDAIHSHPIYSNYTIIRSNTHFPNVSNGVVIQEPKQLFAIELFRYPLAGCPSPSQCVNDTKDDGKVDYSGRMTWITAEGSNKGRIDSVEEGYNVMNSYPNGLLLRGNEAVPVIVDK